MASARPPRSLPPDPVVDDDDLGRRRRDLVRSESAAQPRRRARDQEEIVADVGAENGLGIAGLGDAQQIEPE